MKFIKSAEKYSYYSKNYEYMFLHDLWVNETRDLFRTFLETKIKYTSEPNRRLKRYLFTGFAHNQDELNEALGKVENKDEVLEILKFDALIKKSIFNNCIGEYYPENVNSFDFPNAFTESDIDTYLEIIRKPCASYGLQIRRITTRNIISFWDKTYNREFPLNEYSNMLVRGYAEGKCGSPEKRKEYIKRKVELKGKST